MPIFSVSGRGVKTNRKRKREYKALDKNTALQMAAEDATTVDEIVELSYPPASKTLIDRAEALNLALNPEPTHFEVVYSILVMLIHERRKAEIQLGEDVFGEPWLAQIEPYGIHKSKQGLRVRCWVDPVNADLDIFTESQTRGWHLYLIEEIDNIKDMGKSFVPRAHDHKEDNSLVISISLNNL